MRQLKFDFNNMFGFNVAKHGVTASELRSMLKSGKIAHKHLKSLISHPINRVNLGLEWNRLPFQDSKYINKIQSLGNRIAKKYENVLFLGIGGSYLGLKAAQDALASPYYNEFIRGRAKVYFEGNNLDPQTSKVLLNNLKPKKTFVIVISKSGETTETKVALKLVEAWLKKSVGKNYGRQIIAITDAQKGTLREKVNKAQKRDSLSFRDFELFAGVGGRYSEFNMGLLHLAIIGVNLKEALSGAGAMAKRCSAPSIYKNPAYMYAVLHTILYKRKNKSIAVMMPFSEGLKSTADWYVQLLAESLGKKYTRKIKVSKWGLEEWAPDKRKMVNLGRTPIASRGTNDLHSIQQNNIEGENNKVTTLIRIEDFGADLKISQKGDFLTGKSYSQLMKLAQEATEWSLTRENRPNCTITLPKLDAFHWGGLIFFLEMATAFEGELLNVNAFNQPGVESYKDYMYFKLRKPGQSKRIAEEIRKHSLVRKSRFILSK